MSKHACANTSCVRRHHLVHATLRPPLTPVRHNVPSHQGGCSGVFSTIIVPAPSAAASSPPAAAASAVPSGSLLASYATAATVAVTTTSSAARRLRPAGYTAEAPAAVVGLGVVCSEEK